MRTKASLDQEPSFRVGDVLAVPSQMEVDAIVGGNRDMESIDGGMRRDREIADQRSRKLAGVLGELEKRQAFKRGDSEL